MKTDNESPTITLSMPDLRQNSMRVVYRCCDVGNGNVMEVYNILSEYLRKKCHFKLIEGRDCN